MAVFNFDLRAALERVANQRTGPSTQEPERVVTMPGLDKLHKLIRELQGKRVVIDGEEHQLAIAFAEMERDAETAQADLNKCRSEIDEQIRRHQATLVEAMKQCGIMASVPTKTEATDVPEV
jgi:hypothetical protein